MNSYSLLKPATLDLAAHIAQQMMIAPVGSNRMATLNRIYRNMTPDAQHRVNSGMASLRTVQS